MKEFRSEKNILVLGAGSNILLSDNLYDGAVIKLGKNFYVFTGSTVGVVPILGKGIYQGRIDKLGSVKAIIS